MTAHEPAAGQPRCKLEPGTSIRDTYSVVRFLGAGRFADVYLVRHRFMGMQAMKLLVDDVAEDDRVDGLREAFLLSRLSHPGLVRVFDANRLEPALGGHPYITMEHVTLGSLQGMLEGAEEGLRLDVALDFAEQLASGLAHAHVLEDGLVHRDLKPANILLDRNKDGRWMLRIADFGLAARVDQLLKVVQAGGTLLYMSPESLRGFETPASDVFSAGLVMYEMLTGTLPYQRQLLRDAEGRAEIERRLSAAQQEGFPPPSDFDGRITPDIDSVVARALELNLDDRFQNGGELAAAVTACQHARAEPIGELVRREFAGPLKQIFQSARHASQLAEAAAGLRSLITSHPMVGRAFGPHLQQMREQIASRTSRHT